MYNYNDSEDGVIMRIRMGEDGGEAVRLRMGEDDGKGVRLCVAEDGDGVRLRIWERIVKME